MNEVQHIMSQKIKSHTNHETKIQQRKKFHYATHLPFSIRCHPTTTPTQPIVRKETEKPQSPRKATRTLMQQTKTNQQSAKEKKERNYAIIISLKKREVTPHNPTL
jgi:hypothetical protein